MRGPLYIHICAFKIFSLPVPTRPGTRTFWQVPDPSRPEVKNPYPSDPDYNHYFYKHHNYYYYCRHYHHYHYYSSEGASPFPARPINIVIILIAGIIIVIIIIFLKVLVLSLPIPIIAGNFETFHKVTVCK